MTDPTPRSSFTRTAWAMLAIIGGLIVWDVFLAASPQEGDTISETTLLAVTEYPSILLAIGALVGHLAWPQWLGTPPGPEGRWVSRLRIGPMALCTYERTDANGGMDASNDRPT